MTTLFSVCRKLPSPDAVNRLNDCEYRHMQEILAIIHEHEKLAEEKKRKAPSVDTTCRNSVDPTRRIAVDPTRRMTRSQSKLQQQQHGEGEKPGKHPRRMLTKEKLAFHMKKCQDSDGFDVGDVPEHFLSRWLLVTPHWIRKQGARAPKYLNEMSRISLKRFNDENGSAYKFVKVLRVNSEAYKGVNYYITFQAKDMCGRETRATSCLQNFQTLVNSEKGKRKYRFCRLEKKPKLLEAFSVATMVVNSPAIVLAVNCGPWW